MVSFIVIAKEKKKREAYSKEFAKKHAINTFDITIIEKDETKAQSIGIETVKQIQKKIFFKPIKSKDKLVTIEDAQLLTPEAQNALLKVLEEPPAHTFIILGTETQEVLLPTILSRCQIIILEEEHKKMSEKTLEELNNFVQTLPDLSIGERLKQAEQLAKDKEKAIEWIENLILILRGKLIDNYSSSKQSKLKNNVIPDSDQGSIKIDSRFHGNDNYLLAIKSFQSLHTLLKTTNINPRFAIENTLLSL